MTDVKRHLQGLVDGDRDRIVALSRSVHATPEIRFEERESAAKVADALSSHGFDVEAGACDIETAFVATAGSGPLTIGICAEYDALPGIGHACGHNIIASAAVGAGVALARIADDLGITVRVLGTPAEESGGGKILMMDRGAFDGVHAAMMVHPSPEERTFLDCLAVAHMEIAYHGRAAHASAYPELGVNAADALTVAQVAIGLARQHFKPWDQVHGIVVKGGDAPNVVPSETTARFYLRTENLERLEDLRRRIYRCFEAGALATGATLDMDDESSPYSEFRPDLEIGALYQANAESLGRPSEKDPGKKGGSTDMANISLRMPTIHPMIKIDGKGAVNHQPEFTAACATESADQAVRDGALAMALTVADICAATGLRHRLMENDTVYRTGSR